MTLRPAVILLALSLFLGSSSLSQRSPSQDPSPVPSSAVEVVASDTTWQGSVLIAATTVIPAGVTVTVLPGTNVRFKHYRGYREPDLRLALRVQGALIAHGTPQNPIYFTSDASDPQNGDWSMLRLLPSSLESSFRYVVFECAQHGLNVWNEKVDMAHCVFRWNNWEGVYFESYCAANLDSCLIIENGYNGLAAEQFDTLQLRSCEVRRNGTSGVHADATAVTVQDSWILENGAHGLSVDNNGSLTSLGNLVAGNKAWGIGVGEGNNSVTVGNSVFVNNGAGAVDGPHTTVSYPYDPPVSLSVGFVPDTTYALGYVPGDPLLDKYQYVYPDDETRTVDRKIGAGLGLTWSVAWDGSAIWTATLSGTITKLNPVTGAVLKQFSAPGSQPWGMTFDGTALWLVDFAEKRISKIDTATGAELKTFSTPDPVGGCKGVAWDGTYLNILGWTSSTIYRVDTNGVLQGTVPLAQGGGGGIAWDGTYFWIAGRRIQKYDTLGTARGWIFPCSEGTWDMTWDGTHLWVTQRTNENWKDEKLYRVLVLDDHSPPVSMFVKPGGDDLMSGLSASAAKQHIQAAIDASPTNASIRIAGGTYDENLLLQSKVLTLEGGYDSLTWNREPALRPVVLTGGGRGPVVKVVGGRVTLEDLSVCDGVAGSQGAGGVDITGGATELRRCTVTQNSATGLGEWGGGGLTLLDGALVLSDCSVSDNVSAAGAGGIRIGAGGRYMLTRSTIAGNEGSPALHVNNASGAVIHCTITDNPMGGILSIAPSDSDVITNSILWNNGPADVAGQTPIVTYSNAQQGIGGTGNISSDPLFVNAAERDYHLLASSPCINRGDPSSDPDPDGTRADMGAFFYDFTAGGPSEPGGGDLPGRFTLRQNYPNPFNPATTISFELPRRSLVHLAVFDLLGREVSVLRHQEMPPGNHSVMWHAQGLPTGFYVCRLVAGAHVASLRMVLVR